MSACRNRVDWPRRHRIDRICAPHLIRAIIAAADKDRDEMTVLLIYGEPAAVIAPYGHERRPGAAAEIRFDQTAPPEARLVLTDVWGGAFA